MILRKAMTSVEICMDKKHELNIKDAPFCTSVPEAIKVEETSVSSKKDQTSHCKLCGKEVKSISLSFHLQLCSSDGSKIFHCSMKTCKASFTTKPYLRNHFRTVHKLVPVKCPRDGCKAYLKPNYVERHVKFVHDKVKTFCENCGEVLTAWAKLDHRYKCTSGRAEKFSCTFGDCKSSFIEEKYLIAHQNKSHSAPIKCPRENCNIYMKPSSLDQHLRRIHDCAKEPCELCGEELPVGKLKRHLFRCRKKRVSCTHEDCELTFRDEYDREVHLMTVHRPPVQCPRQDCWVVVQPCNLAEHLRTAHSGDHGLEHKVVIKVE